MRSGAISETFGILPAMKMTEPYSPTPRAKARAKPVTAAGIRVGRMTSRNVCRRVAPSVAEASSYCLSISSMTGSTVRTTKGRPMNVRAMTMPKGV
jgi:hypothetical protein